MKRMQLIAAALCLVMITTIGAGVVAAKQEVQAPQKDKYQFEVTYEKKPVGKLVVNAKQLTFAFTGKKLTAGTTYFLVWKEGARSLGSAAAAADGTVLLQDALDPSVVDVTAHPTFILAMSPPVRNTVQAPTRATITSSPTAQVPGGSVALTAFVEKFDAATNTWSAASNAAVRLMRSNIAETQPTITGGWYFLGDYKTDASGKVQIQAQVPSTGFYGFKAWKTSFAADDPLAASMSPAVWVETKHATHWFDRPYSPTMTRQLVMLGPLPIAFDWAVTVDGKILDENNKPVANQKVEVFFWDSKQLISTVTTDNQGYFKWGKNYVFTDTPPADMGVRSLGDSSYRGLSDTKCYIITIYPPPPS